MPKRRCSSEPSPLWSSLTRPDDSHPIAHVDELTAAAEWGNRLTKILSVGHKQIIEGDPVALRESGAERLFGLFRRLRLHISPTVADPVNMDIHADPRFLVADRYHQIGCLSADACEGN